MFFFFKLIYFWVWTWEEDINGVARDISLKVEFFFGVSSKNKPIKIFSLKVSSKIFENALNIRLSFLWSRFDIQCYAQVFCKQSVLNIFAKFTGKHLYRSLFLNNKVTATLLKNRLAQVFSCEFCEIFKNTFFYRTPPVAPSERKYPTFGIPWIDTESEAFKRHRLPKNYY